MIPWDQFAKELPKECSKFSQTEVSMKYDVEHKMIFVSRGTEYVCFIIVTHYFYILTHAIIGQTYGMVHGLDRSL